MKTLLLVAGGRGGSDFFQGLLDGHTQILSFPLYLKIDDNFIQILNEENPEKLAKQFINFVPEIFNSKINKFERHHRLGKNRNKHFKVNKKKVNISSYLVKEEDLIEVKDKSKALTIIDTSLSSKEREVPEYIQLDTKNKTAKLVRVPKFADIPYPTVMEPKLVIEYYSR